MANRYIARSRLTDAQVLQMVRLFAADTHAAGIAATLGLSRNTVDRFLGALRRRVDSLCRAASPFGSSVIEVNTDYLEALRSRGRTKPTISFGIILRGGRIYVQAVHPCTLWQLHSVVLERLGALSTSTEEGIYTYEAIASAYFRNWHLIHRPVDTRDNSVGAKDRIAAFCAYTRDRLRRLRGVPSELLLYHVRECEMRFGTPSGEIEAGLTGSLMLSPVRYGSHIDGPEGGTEHGVH